MVKNEIVVDDYFSEFLPQSLYKFNDIHWEDVVYCEAAGSYSILHFINGAKVKKSVNLATISFCQRNDSFIRCHRKYIVNFKYVKAVTFGKQSELRLTNNELIPISQRNRPVFKRKCGEYLLENKKFHQN